MLELDLRLRRDGFSLEVALACAGPLAVVGPNGAGKSTLMAALVGALPCEGALRVSGLELGGVPPEGRGVGYLPQKTALFRHLSAAENVGFGQRDRARVRAVMDQLGIGDLADRRPAQLSGGEAQRVALGRALAPDPGWLVLDEPTAALDVVVRPQVRRMLVDRFGRVPAVVVTHDVRDLVAWHPTIALIEGGRLAALGSLDELRDHPHPFLKELLGPLVDGIR